VVWAIPNLPLLSRLRIHFVGRELGKRREEGTEKGRFGFKRLTQRGFCVTGDEPSSVVELFIKQILFISALCFLLHPAGL
jgi:hypothetical protein